MSDKLNVEQVIQELTKRHHQSIQKSDEFYTKASLYEHEAEAYIIARDLIKENLKEDKE